MNATQFLDGVILDVSELPDRNSPPDDPDMMLVTGKELREILIGRLEHAGLEVLADEALTDDAQPTRTVSIVLLGAGAVNVALAMQCARLVLAMLEEEKIVIVSAEPALAQIIEKLDAIDAGKCRLAGIEGFPRIVLDDKPADGLAFTTDDGLCGNVERFELHWRAV